MPPLGASGGGVEKRPKSFSHKGTSREREKGTQVFSLGVSLRTGSRVLRYAIRALRSSSAMPEYASYGMRGKILSPFGRMPLVMASKISLSDQLPSPVSLSGGMLVAYTVPKGMGKARPPTWGVPSGIVWQPQPPAIAKIY